MLRKKVFVETSLNSLENLCARASFLIKLQASGLSFPVNFKKFLRTYFLQKNSGRLLLSSHNRKRKLSLILWPSSLKSEIFVKYVGNKTLVVQQDGEHWSCIAVLQHKLYCIEQDRVHPSLST